MGQAPHSCKRITPHGTPFHASRLRTLKQGFRKEEVNSHPHKYPRERKRQKGVNPLPSLPHTPFPGQILPPLARAGFDGEGGLETRPMKKMSLPHTQKWPQGGAQRLIGKDILSSMPPHRPEGGHRGMPHPPSSQRGGESRDRKLGWGWGVPEGTNSSSSSNPNSRVHETWTDA